MKKYFFTILSVVSAATLISCKDLLDTYPADQIATGNMWTSETLADQGINGLYENFYIINMSTDQVHLKTSVNEGIYNWSIGGQDFMMWNSKNSGATMYLLCKATKYASDADVIYQWRWCYTGIHRVNDAIANLYRAGLSTEKYERYMCEAKFLRAWYYTRLNTLYQGVPIYLEPISSSECTKTQSEPEEVWDVVIDDLTYCIENEYCPENTINENYGRPSKGAAYALRANAYLMLAWQYGDDNAYYQQAADDYEKVSQCGYGLWAGKYIDFFNDTSNEKDHEMIFPIQYTMDVGFTYCLQMVTGGRDSWYAFAVMRPSFESVTYYQNSDGTKFDWASRIPEWNDDVFQNDLSKREVFFLRDSISLDDNDKVISDYWDQNETATIQERINTIGADIVRKYYLKDGNEDRIRSCFNDRDPRLKQTVLTPYDPYDTYAPQENSGIIQYAKEKRWPYLTGFGDNKDYYCGVAGEDTYLFKKWNFSLPDQIMDRLQCDADWPLIRYTDVCLHLAECYVHLGRLSDAVTIVNQVRARAEMPAITVGSAEEVMEAVKYERRVELILECVDWLDEYRWGTYKETKFQGNDIYGPTNYWGQWENRTEAQTWYYDDCLYPWGAPSTEAQRNPNIKKRDGWAY